MSQGLNLGVGVFVPVREFVVRVVRVDLGRHYFHPTFGEKTFAFSLQFSEVVEFNADREMIEFGTSPVVAAPGVPCLHVEGHELDELPVTGDHEVGGCSHVGAAKIKC